MRTSLIFLFSLISFQFGFSQDYLGLASMRINSENGNLELLDSTATGFEPTAFFLGDSICGGSSWFEIGTDDPASVLSQDVYRLNKIGINRNTAPYELSVDGKLWLNNSVNSTAIGYQAMANNAGANAVALGYQAGRDHQGMGLTALGFRSALFSNGGFIIAIGVDAARSAKGAQDGIFIGREAGVAAKGIDQIAIGRNALKNAHSSIPETIAIGTRTLENTTTGRYNVAVGAAAGVVNTTGANNTYIGWRAGFQNNGSNNTYVGESANDQSRDAHDNTAMGWEVQHDNYNGNGNTSIGAKSLHSLSTLSSTSSMVAGAKYKIRAAGSTDFTQLGAANNTGGTEFIYNGNSVSGTGQVKDLDNPPHGNTAIGHFAGRFVGQGRYNVFVGYNAGYHSVYSGKSNQLIIENSSSPIPLIGGDFEKDEVKIGGVQQFSKQYTPDGAGVANGSMFYGTDGALYFKGGSGTVTQLAPQ